MIEKKVLMLASQEIVEEQNDGGKKGSFRNYELLQRVFGKKNVYIYMITNHLSNVEYPINVKRIKAYENIFDRFINVYSGRLFTSKKNERKIINFIRDEQIDILFADRSLYGSLLSEMKNKHINCEVWTFVHNIERNFFKNKLKKYPLVSKIICKRIDWSEATTLKLSDYIMALTSRDATLIHDIYKRKVDDIIPTTFKDVYDKNRVKNYSFEKLHLLFIGTMFGPNYEGILWFVKNVMDKLKNVDLTIVGKGFENKRTELARDNVNVIGTVEDLEEYYYSNSVMVMPIFYGDGQKVKTAEAMMYGKIIMATDEALEGYDVEGVKGIFRCNSVDDYIEEIENLLNEKNNIDGNAVRECFINKYCFENYVVKYRKIWLERCMEK